jgi:hypothetical protein
MTNTANAITASPGNGPGTKYTTLDDLWRPPAPSKSTRQLSRKSKGSSRAIVVGGTPARAIQCESNLERKSLLMLLARRDVADVVEQPPAVIYTDEEGRVRRHVFDYFVTMTDDTTVAVEVKPLDKVEKYHWRERLQQIADQAEGFADRYVLITEENLPPEATFNAALIHSVRRDDKPEHDQHVRRIAADLHGQVTIADLVARSGLAGDGFRAIARLIGAGELIAVGRGRIDYPSFISRAEAA